MQVCQQSKSDTGEAPDLRSGHRSGHPASKQPGSNGHSSLGWNCRHHDQGIARFSRIATKGPGAERLFRDEARGPGKQRLVLGVDGGAVSLIATRLQSTRPVEDRAFLVDRAPQVGHLAVHLHVHSIEVSLPLPALPTGSFAACKSRRRKAFRRGAQGQISVRSVSWRSDCNGLIAEIADALLCGRTTQRAL